MLEEVIYHRLLPLVEPQLEPAQFAYRRARETGQLLSAMMDTAQRALLEEKYVYIISFSIVGAFDSVSHHQLAQTLSHFEVDVYTQRIIHNWSRNRFFRIKLRAPTGVYQEADSPISSGLPQGGESSPLL